MRRSVFTGSSVVYLSCRVCVLCTVCPGVLDMHELYYACVRNVQSNAPEASSSISCTCNVSQ